MPLLLYEIFRTEVLLTHYSAVPCPDKNPIIMQRSLGNLLLLLFFIPVLHAQRSITKIDSLTSGTKTSLRGLSAVTDDIIWVSGSNGTVGKSLDGGKNWQWIKVKDFEKK